MAIGSGKGVDAPKKENANAEKAAFAEFKQLQEKQMQEMNELLKAQGMTDDRIYIIGPENKISIDSADPHKND